MFLLVFLRFPRVFLLLILSVSYFKFCVFTDILKNTIDQSDSNIYIQSTNQATNLKEKTELMAEAEFMEKRQTLEQQAQKLKIATKVSKSKAYVKLPENTRK